MTLFSDKKDPILSVRYQTATDGKVTSKEEDEEEENYMGDM